MSAGTIAVTNGSATVTGSGTSFTTEMKAGDFIGVIAGGTPYTLIVSSITSDTQLTTGAAYAGPSATGLAWNAVPASLLYAVTQQIMNDMGTALRGMNSQLTNWQKIYSDSASVTVDALTKRFSQVRAGDMWLPNTPIKQTKVPIAILQASAD